MNQSCAMNKNVNLAQRREYPLNDQYLKLLLLMHAEVIRNIKRQISKILNMSLY